MSNIVEIQGLTKSYGSHLVLNNISLALEEGEIIGLLGPNGSGKTSLIKILSGLITDYTGDVRIDGHTPSVHTKSMIAYLPEKTYLPNWMTCKDAIDYIADFYADFDKEKALHMLDVFQLPIKQKVKTMSKGMQEKLQLLLVMCRNAKLYILDEPLGGVDPAARAFILDTILKNHPEGSTLLISTHLIYDVERVFDSVLMIGQGNVLLQDKTENIRAAGKNLEDAFKEVFQYAWQTY